ncbi:MAG: alcohol dehydrogenase catalytic domain-containing protein, partial [Eudoraea sp.]|uniref:alcohol dehydrogenase catalytic domain-containing protein n=1 Tax=Eudoraea sp. TaxID=1979955 RepID=UPI003C773723
MKYIVCEKPGLFKLKEKSNPQKVEGQAILGVKKIGICGTDLHAYKGNQAFFTYPRILGHELAAEVIDIEENNHNIKVGDKVIVM